MQEEKNQKSYIVLGSVIVLIGVLLSNLWTIYNIVYPDWELNFFEYLYGISFRLYALCYIPFGVIFSLVLGNKKLSIWVLAISSVILVPKLYLAQIIEMFLFVFVCGNIWQKEKVAKWVKVLLVAGVSTLLIFLVAILDGATVFKDFAWIGLTLGTFGLLLAMIIVLLLLEKVPVIRNIQKYNEQLDKNYRKQSLNVKIMKILNVTCMVLLLAISLFAVYVLYQVERENNLEQSIVFGELLENALKGKEDIYSSEDEKDYESVAEIISKTCDGMILQLPAEIQVRGCVRDGVYRFVDYIVEDNKEAYGISVVCTGSAIIDDEAVLSQFRVLPKKGELEILVDPRADFKDKILNMLEKIFAMSLVIMAFMNLIVEHYIRKNVVKPINEMTTIAMEFAYDDESKRQESRERFKELQIHSGDEIESLYMSFEQSMSDMTNYMDYIKEKTEQLTQMQHNVITTMADIIESRDENTGGHIKRTAVYVEIIARKLQKEGIYADVLTDEYIENMIVAAPLHDMGKIHVPDNILNKNGRLTDDEFEIMKAHTISGRELLGNASEQLGVFSYLNVAIDMAENHHEWWNGNGYPSKKSGEDIPLCARIMAVADVFDALVSKRCYKPAMDVEKARNIIEEEMGTHFDPVVAKAFLDCMDEVLVVLETFTEE